MYTIIATPYQQLIMIPQPHISLILISMMNSYSSSIVQITVLHLRALNSVMSVHVTSIMIMALLWLFTHAGVRVTSSLVIIFICRDTFLPNESCLWKTFKAYLLTVRSLLQMKRPVFQTRTIGLSRSSSLNSMNAVYPKQLKTLSRRTEWGICRTHPLFK